MHIQKMFVIIAFNESLLEKAVSLLGYFPYVGQKLQEPFKAFLIRQKMRLHRRAESDVPAVSWLSFSCMARGFQKKKKEAIWFLFYFWSCDSATSRPTIFFTNLWRRNFLKLILGELTFFLFFSGWQFDSFNIWKIRDSYDFILRFVNSELSGSKLPQKDM